MVSLLSELHHLLFEVHVIEGFLICPESGNPKPISSVAIFMIDIYAGRKFPIHDGIPNMLLHEDEV